MNPYTPGAGRRPVELVGRDSQFALVEAAAQQFEAGFEAESIIFYGLRGMGKTVFLRDVSDLLRDRGWLCGYYSVRHGVRAGVAVGNLIAEAAPLLPSGSRLARALSQLSARLGTVTLTAGPGGITVEATASGAGGAASVRGGGSGLGTGGGHDDVDLFGDLVKVLTRLGQHARDDGTGVALLVDELQELQRADMAALIDAVGTVSSLPVMLIGAGLPYLPSELSTACTWAERLRYESLGPLPPTAARVALTAPAEAVGMTLSAEALDMLVQEAAGYPFFLQLYASESWKIASSTGRRAIRIEDVTEAVPVVKRILADGLYAARYGRASAAERTYLEAVARLEAAQPAGGVRSGEVAKTLGKPLSALSPTRDNLIKKGLLESPARGVIRFTVPGFGPYVLWRSEEA